MSKTTEDYREKVIDMRTHGSTYREISSAIGLSPTAIMQFCNKNNIKPFDPSKIEIEWFLEEANENDGAVAYVTTRFNGFPYPFEGYRLVRVPTAKFNDPKGYFLSSGINYNPLKALMNHVGLSYAALERAVIQEYIDNIK